MVNEMDVSFILSTDELFTLISQMSNQTQAGKAFVDKALAGAQISDLSMLPEKNLARVDGEELTLAPVVQMLIDAISNASRAEYNGKHWEIDSGWVILQCERYPFIEEHWKLTPKKGAM